MYLFVDAASVRCVHWQVHGNMRPKTNNSPRFIDSSSTTECGSYSYGTRQQLYACMYSVMFCSYIIIVQLYNCAALRPRPFSIQNGTRVCIEEDCNEIYSSSNRCKCRHVDSVCDLQSVHRSHWPMRWSVASRSGPAPDRCPMKHDKKSPAASTEIEALTSCH